MKNAKALYENIMKNISKELKKSLNEAVLSSVINGLSKKTNLKKIYWDTYIDLHNITDDNIQKYQAGDKNGIKIMQQVAKRGDKFHRNFIIFYAKTDNTYSDPLAYMTGRGLVTLCNRPTWHNNDKDLKRLLKCNLFSNDLTLTLIKDLGNLYNFAIIDIEEYNTNGTRVERHGNWVYGNRKNIDDRTSNEMKHNTLERLKKSRIDDAKKILTNINNNKDTLREILLKDIKNPKNISRYVYPELITTIFNLLELDDNGFNNMFKHYF